MKLTRAQAHRLIELYGYTGARDRLELDTGQTQAADSMALTWDEP